MYELRRLVAAISCVGTVLAGTAGAAMAQVPENWQLGMQTAHSPVKQGIASLHGLLMVIITVITLFVAGLLLWALYRYKRSSNPTAGRFSHNTTLEVAWTVIPVLILVVIAIPSFRLVYFEDRAREIDMTIKVTGHQWLWEYTYPDNGNINFLSSALPDDQLKPGQLRLLDVDSPLVLPAGKNIRILTTSADVIHSFFIPSLGVQRYAIPGRTIETWVKIDQPGDYYGECNQICGTNHSDMPISIHALSAQDFAAWAKQAAPKATGAVTPAVKSAPGGGNAAAGRADDAGPVRLAQARQSAPAGE